MSNTDDKLLAALQRNDKLVAEIERLKAQIERMAKVWNQQIETP